MPSIDAAVVLADGGRRGPARVHLADGVITAIEPLESVGRTAAHRTLAPGFVDLQVNGIDDIDVATADGADWDELGRRLLSQGVTAWCPTLVSRPLDRYGGPLERIRVAQQRAADRELPEIVGVHLEGPFLGEAAGAHRAEHVVPIDLAWLEHLPDHVAAVTLGAEQPMALDATRLLVGRGVAVSIGHTRATEQQFDAVVHAGASLVTHTFNAMSGVHHREPGVAAFALTSGVSASLIADGIHVHPRVLRLAFAALGVRAVLVSDQVAWRSGALGGRAIEVREGAPRLPDGTLAGSTLTLDRAVRVCTAAGIDLADAVHAATRAPAQVVGRTDLGIMSPGMRGDLVALDRDGTVEQVWRAGVPVLGV